MLHVSLMLIRFFHQLLDFLLLILCFAFTTEGIILHHILSNFKRLILQLLLLQLPGLMHGGVLQGLVTIGHRGLGMLLLILLWLLEFLLMLMLLLEFLLLQLLLLLLLLLIGHILHPLFLDLTLDGQLLLLGLPIYDVLRVAFHIGGVALFDFAVFVHAFRC